MSRLIVNIDVPNLDDGIAFYTEGLGFQLRRTLFQRSVAELRLGEFNVYLIEQKAGTQPFPAANEGRTFERHWTPVHIDIVVADMSAALEKAVAAGAVRSGDTTTHDWGILTPLSDPFGHGVCLLQFSPAGYDTVAD